MNSLKYTQVLALLLLILSACEKEIKYKGENINNILVINANLNADSTISCSLSKSRTIFEQDIYNTDSEYTGGITSELNNAIVELYCDGKLMDKPEKQYATYKWENIKAEEGKKYTINVKNTPYKEISASTTIPNKIEVDFGNPKYNGEGYLDFNIVIHDKPEENFFRLEMYQVIREELGEYYMPIIIDSDDPVLNFNKIVTGNDEMDLSDMPDNNYMIFNDALFNGENHKIKFTAFVASGYDATEIFVNVQHITKDLYQYLNTIQSRRYYEDNPIVEPIMIYTNVKNGAGIVGSLNTTIKGFKY